ncbi:MAG: sigma-70 family RNA polymerase sigma factor [Vicinamibacterales bacterium]|nr:sigma-70 family RNA polymerase sigma factor [Vicinamibacterales bacterium]
MSDTAERDLIARCRQGEDGAFRELVDQYKGLVFALVARTIRDPSRAEDLAQEVFLKIHRGLPYFRGDARLSTWIYRIVVNLCASERPSRDVPLDAGDEERPAWEPGGPDRAYGDVELRDRLDKAIRRLPAHYRVLVAGHYLRGMKYEDLAEALHLPMGTVKTHLHRAKRLLREMLEEPRPGSEQRTANSE